MAAIFLASLRMESINRRSVQLFGIRSSPIEGQTLMETHITITSRDWAAVNKALFTPDGAENAGVLFCGTSLFDRCRKLLVRRFLPVAPEFYVERESHHLEIAPAFYNRVVSDCLADRLTPVIVHSHPFHGEAVYSSSDDYGESRLLGTLDALLPDTRPASLVISHTSATAREVDNAKCRLLRGI